MKKGILIIAILGFLVFCGIIIKRKNYDPKIRIEKARKEVIKLTNQNLIRSGDHFSDFSLRTR